MFAGTPAIIENITRRKWLLFLIISSTIVLIYNLYNLLSNQSSDPDPKSPPSSPLSSETPSSTQDSWTIFEGVCGLKALGGQSTTLDDAKKACVANPDCVAIYENAAKGRFEQRGSYCKTSRKPSWWKQEDMCDAEKKHIAGAGCKKSTTHWLKRT